MQPIRVFIRTIRQIAMLQRAGWQLVRSEPAPGGYYVWLNRATKP